MRLLYDPFPAFLESLTPCGIYVRRMMLGESSPDLEEVRRDHLRRLYATQQEDGSWNGSVIDTIEALTTLYLCEIDVSQTAERAVAYLLEGPYRELPQDRPVSSTAGLFKKMSTEDRGQLRTRQDLIVNKGSAVFAKTGAALFFSSQFNREGDPRVIQAFRQLDRLFEKDGAKWGPYPSANNILLAYSSHPLKKSSRTTRVALADLEKTQRPDGTWAATPCFFHTFHTVALSVLPSSTKQFERAYKRVVETQNEDGTWGKTVRSFSRFLSWSPCTGAATRRNVRV